MKTIFVNQDPHRGLEGRILDDLSTISALNTQCFQGYEKVKEFIVTQHPTEETRDAFWTMLWDHNAQTVVLLTPTSDEEVGHTEIQCCVSGIRCICYPWIWDGKK
jgi:hypothetical protein